MTAPDIRKERRAFAHAPHLYAAGLGAGLLGAALMSVAIALSRFLGLPIVGFSTMLGILATGQATLSAWLIGFLWHLVDGALIGTVYVFGFKLIGRAGKVEGALFGLIHWLIAGYGVGALPVWRVAPFFQLTPELNVFQSTASGPIIFVYFLLHLFFGMLVGAVVGYQAEQVALAAKVGASEEHHESAA